MIKDDHSLESLWFSIKWQKIEKQFPWAKKLFHLYSSVVWKFQKSAADKKTNKFNDSRKLKRGENKFKLQRL